MFSLKGSENEPWLISSRLDNPRKAVFLSLIVLPVINDSLLSFIAHPTIIVTLTCNGIAAIERRNMSANMLSLVRNPKRIRKALNYFLAREAKEEEKATRKVPPNGSERDYMREKTRQGTAILRTDVLLIILFPMLVIFLP